MAEIEGSKITDITGGSELDKMDARAKAAVVVVSLGADRASQIYKYLSEQEIEDLTYEVAKLGKTNNAQVENAVLSEFWVFQEKVDMKVSAFSFTTSLLVFGYL